MVVFSPPQRVALLCGLRSTLILTKNRSDALRFALDHSTPEGSEPLVSMVVERTKLELRDGGKGRDNYSVLVRIQFTPTLWNYCMYVCWLQRSVVRSLGLV